MPCKEINVSSTYKYLLITRAKVHSFITPHEEFPCFIEEDSVEKLGKREYF